MERTCSLGVFVEDRGLVTTGVFQRLCEQLHAHVPLRRILCQCFEQHGFDRLGQGRILLPQAGGRDRGVLVHDLPARPFERTDSTEPFVGQGCEGVLITGKTGFPPQLLRGHVSNSASHFLSTEQVG